MNIIYAIVILVTPLTLFSQFSFGDDTSAYALDGECDDPRFQGQGMAPILSDDNTGRDATDCRLLFNQSAITND